MELVVWNVKNEAWAVNVMKGNGDGMRRNWDLTYDENVNGFSVFICCRRG